MGKSSTLFYIVNNTSLSDKAEVFSLEDFAENTDQFLSSFFNEFEFEVNDKVVDRILEACR
jgi:hypothetical protein